MNTINEPWEAQIDWAPDFPRGSHVSDSVGNEIATNVSGEQANLIAAAPDLLNRAKQEETGLIALRNMVEDGNAFRAIMLIDGMLRSTRAAIKKAKGE